MTNDHERCQSSADPDDCIIDIIESKFDNLLNACRKTAYYSRRFPDMEIFNRPGACLQDTGWFSLTMKQRAAHLDELELSGGIYGLEAPGSLHAGGRLYTTWEEIYRATAFIEFMMRNAGVDDSDRFINCYDFSYNGFGVMHQRLCERMGVFCVPAGKVEAVQVYSRIEPYDITVLMGHAGLLVQTTKIAQEQGAPPLKAIFMTSERVQQDVRDWMQKVWRCPVYMGFGVMGIYPAVAMESPGRDRFIVNELSYIVETPPESNGSGELHITPLDFCCHPTMRLATGVAGQLHLRETDSGARTESITGLEQALGALLSIGDTYFDPERFFSALSEKIPDADTAYKTTRGDMVETLIFNSNPEHRETFMETLRETDPALMKNVAPGMARIEFADS